MTPVQRSTWVVALAAGAAGAAIALIGDHFLTTAPATGAVQTTQARSADDASVGRGSRAAQIATLQQRLDVVEAQLARATPVASAETGFAQGVGDPENADFTDDQSQPGGSRSPQSYTVADLIAGGVPPDRAAAVLEIADSVTLQRMEAMFAAGQDPQRRRQMFSELPSVREAITSSFDELTYDQYLYATGQPNRVGVARVIQGSPADAAGLLAGDTVIGLAGEPIYNRRGLHRATRSGTPGELVAVTVQREQQTFDVYLPRGPLGVMTQTTSVRPDGDG